MKVLIIFSSPTHNEYTRWWSNSECKNESENNHLVFSGEDWRIYVFNGENYKNGDWPFDNIQNEILGVLNSDSDSIESLGVLLHDTDTKQIGRLRSILKICSGDGALEAVCMGYSSVGTKVGDLLRKFAESCNGDIISKLFEELDKEKVHEKVNEAIRLRYEILSPFVAIDFLKQSGNFKDSNDEVGDAINKINSDGLITALCRIITCGEQVEGQDDLEDKMLDLLNLSNGPVAKSGKKEYHENLKGIAAELEKQIEKLEATR